MPSDASRPFSCIYSSDQSGQLWIHVLGKPAERLAPPQSLILRLPDPVAFVRKVDQTARHTLALQRREQRETFGIRHTIIELAYHHQMRRVKVSGREMRRPAAVHRVHRVSVPVLSLI